MLVVELDNERTERKTERKGFDKQLAAKASALAEAQQATIDCNVLLSGRNKEVE